MKRMPYDDQDHYVELLKNVLRKSYRVIAGLHRYFSILGHADLTTMSATEWDLLLNMTDVVDPESRHCNFKACQTLFAMVQPYNAKPLKPFTRVMVTWNLTLTLTLSP
eukprot:3334958-Pyramimonas_sp.AAC.2